MTRHHKIAMLTAGGLAPCLSSAVGGLIERYSEIAPEAQMIGYLSGYKGLLQGKSITVTPEVRRRAHVLHSHGGTPLGNSRVKLTNVADCVKRGLVKEGEDPLKVAANQLVKDGVTILHTIGGDDTNTTAADLAAYLHGNGYELTVVGLPKTIDNDVVPIRQTLGAWTAAEHGALFFENVVNEQSTSSRQLVIHEVMGRNCGWLTAATARAWRERLDALEFLPEFNLDRRHKEIHAIYIPEMHIDIEAEADAAAQGDGRARLGVDLRQRRRLRRRDRGGDGIQGREGGPRRLRPCPARQREGGRLVRQAVRARRSARTRHSSRSPAISAARRRPTRRTSS